MTSAVMISCRQRREERQRTLASLAEYGIHPRVAESPCEPASRAENRRVGLEALTLATSGEPVLFCEDDIRASPRLPPFLRLALQADLTVSMCVLRNNVYHPVTRDEIKAGGPMRPRLEQVGLYRWYGTQCVLLPPRVVEAVLASPRRTETRPDGTSDGFDFLLRAVLADMGERLYVALPNPVQHTAPPSVVAGKGQAAQSTTFHLRADRPISFATLDDRR